MWLLLLRILPVEATTRCRGFEQDFALEKLGGLNWVAVKEFKLGDYIRETLLFAIYPFYGNPIIQYSNYPFYGNPIYYLPISW